MAGSATLQSNPSFLNARTNIYTAWQLRNFMDGDPPGPGHDTAEALRSVTPHLQSVIGRQVRMKYTPHLVFREDPAMRTGERVDEILRRLHSEAE